MTPETPVPVSVVIPTIGRTTSLTACLESVAACEPHASEILVVDQSGYPEVREIVGRFASAGARLIPCSGTGVSRGRNTGISNATHEVVLVTDDDCTVASDWVATAWRLMTHDSARILTGQVKPLGDPRAVPSFKVDDEPRDFTGEVSAGALFPNNMVVNRDLVLDAGGFDERFRPSEAAEDNDFCYRWLKSGRVLCYEPALVVWHHDWRSPEELESLYFRYARGQGFLYAKHLREGDLRMLSYIVRDVYYAVRGLAAAALKGRESWTDPRRGIVRGLPAGLWYGWQVFFSRRSRLPTGDGAPPA